MTDEALFFTLNLQFKHFKMSLANGCVPKPFHLLLVPLALEKEHLTALIAVREQISMLESCNYNALKKHIN